MQSNETTYQDLIDDVQNDDSVTRFDWLESMVKHLQSENDRLHKELFENRFEKPLWGLWGFVIGSVVGMVLMGLVIQNMGAK